MTSGTDTAPKDARLRFLGVWRFLSHIGNASGPLLVSSIAALAGLAAGIVSAGSIGLLDAVGLLVVVSKNSTHARRPGSRCPGAAAVLFLQPEPQDPPTQRLLCGSAREVVTAVDSALRTAGLGAAPLLSPGMNKHVAVRLDYARKPLNCPRPPPRARSTLGKNTPNGQERVRFSLGPRACGEPRAGV